MRISMILGALVVFSGTTAFADDAGTERTWKAKCGSCHGNDGKAQTEKGKKDQVDDLTTAEFQNKFTDEQIKTAIEKGAKKEVGGRTVKMEGYASKLKPEQIDELVKYVRKLGGK